MRSDREVVVITGGAQGLGRAYTEALCRTGRSVVIVDVLGDLANEAAAQLRQGGGDVFAFELDVAEPSMVEAVFDRIRQEVGTVRALINNAGGAFVPAVPIEDFDVTDWHRVLAVNLTGAWLCTRAVVPEMKRARRGTVLNISSTTVSRGYPIGLSAYMAAKGGVVGLTRTLAHELGEFGITVNAIAPGYTPVETEKHVHIGDKALALRQQMVDEQCLKRSETPNDITGAVVFLLSEAAGFITGQVINVDGGWVHN